MLHSNKGKLKGIKTAGSFQILLRIRSVPFWMRRVVSRILPCGQPTMHVPAGQTSAGSMCCVVLNDNTLYFSLLDCEVT